MAPNQTPKKPGKGEILGMPKWAAGIAIALGLVVGYFLLSKRGGGSSDAGGQEDNAGFGPESQDQGGSGGGLGLADLHHTGVVLPEGDMSTGASNGSQSISTDSSSQSPTGAETNISQLPPGWFPLGGHDPTTGNIRNDVNTYQPSVSTPAPTTTITPQPVPYRAFDPGGKLAA